MKGLAVTWVLLMAVLTAATQEDKPMGPKKELPDDALFKDPAAFCEGCYGMVHGKWMVVWVKVFGDG